ncbi:MAG TPA: leucyl/phenylalanyl-tRNA--protein transferase [Vicinamibacterales bacterium]|jgi:leucyl/phenylalanyl-tRNA--protein transferase|nr:leucyl/phenylalanyl-tRNA--protein transferase [Vicinamibacterales bacterium]
MIPFLAPGARFPPVERALRRPDGLLAAGGDLSVATLVRAYRQGIFPWFNEGDPILWWSPNPRMVLRCAEFHVSRTLRRRLNRHDVRVSLDEAFTDVVAACAAPRDEEGGTWLVPEMQAAYLAMHAEGLAHSVEVWRGDQLVGGLYGVALGRMFFGESMVARETDASKMAMAWLSAQLLDWDMPLVDCQMATPHLASLGARAVPRRQFTAWVTALANQPGPAEWCFDAGLDPVAKLGIASTELARD